MDDSSAVDKLDMRYNPGGCSEKRRRSSPPDPRFAEGASETI
jgi:hypothetical protein